MLQYIGARYVPIFYQNSLDPTSSEWEANVTYEPMTWVSLPNGYMYISKKTVPANIGTPAQNGEYWLEAGQYNAYIQSLQDQIDDMNDGTVTGSLQNQINTMQDGSVSGSLQDQINDNVNDIATNAENIGNLAYLYTTDKSSLVHAINEVWTNDNKKEVNLANRYFLFVGDSYGDPGVVNPNWVDFVVEQMGLQSGHYFNVCTSASGFIAGGTKFIDELDLYTGNKNIITDIVVYGGLNDALFSNTSDALFNSTATAIASFATKARTDYPNAQLWLGYNGNAIDNSPSIPAGTRKWIQRQWANYVYSQYGPRNGFKMIANGDKTLCLNILLYGSDHVHPNTDGSRIIALAASQALLGAEYTPFMPKTDIGMTVRSGRTIIGTGEFTYGINNDVCHIHYQGNRLINTPDISVVSDGAWYEYCNLSWVYFNEPVIAPIEVVLRTPSGMMSYQGQFKFDGDKLYFNVKEFDSSTHTYKSVTLDSGNPQVILTDIDIDVPTLYIN